MTNADELLPCRCGGSPIVEVIPPHKHALAKYMPDYPGGKFVACDKCSAMTSSTQDWNCIMNSPELSAAPMKIEALAAALEFYREGKFHPNRDKSRVANHALAMAGKRPFSNVRRFSFTEADLGQKYQLGEQLGIEDDADGEKIDLYVVFSQNGVIVAEEDKKPVYTITNSVDLSDPQNFKIGSF